jgi:hypothetical protein
MVSRKTSRSLPTAVSIASKIACRSAFIVVSSRERRKTLALELARERPEATTPELAPHAVSWPRLAGRRDQGVHVVQILFEGAASARRETEIGPGRAPDERFLAGDVSGLPRASARGR